LEENVFKHVPRDMVASATANLSWPARPAATFKERDRVITDVFWEVSQWRI